MSTLSIRQAFEKRLATLSPALSTAFENVDFTPVVNVPYQRVNLLPAQPDNSVMGQSFYREQGLFQVMLCYPLNAGTGAIQARAEAVKTLFKRGVTMEEDGLKIHSINTPKVSAGFKDNDSYCIPITIYYIADIYL